MKKLLAIVLSMLLLLGLGAVQVGASEPELAGTLRFVSGETDEEQVTVHKEIIAEFEALHPGVKIELELTGFDDREQKIISDLYAGVPIDLIQVDSESAGLYAKNGLLLEMDDIVQNVGADDFMNGSRLVLDGHDYAIPYAGANMMMYVRTDLLEEAGLEIPTTWDELRAAAEALTKDGQYGIVLPAGQNNATTLWLQTFINQAGGNVFGEDLVPTLDTQPVIDALTLYQDLGKYCPPGIASYSYGENINAFVSGQVAIAFYQGRIIHRMYTGAPDLDDKYVLVKMPEKDGLEMQFASYVYYAIGKNCENPELAKAFLEYLTTGDRALRVSMSAPGHMPPPLKSVRAMVAGFEDEFVQSHLDKIEFGMAHAEGGFNEAVNAGGVKGDHVEFNGIINPYYGYVRQYNILSKMVQRVVIEGADPATVAAEGQAELVAVIEENK